MSANLHTIRTRVRNLVGSNVAISVEEIDAIIRAEHVTILNDNSWSSRKAEGTISTHGPTGDGTVTTLGTVVTGSGTAFTEAMAIQKRWIRFGSSTLAYRITSWTSATEITIETEVAEGALTDPTEYSIFQNQYRLPIACERVTQMTALGVVAEAARIEIDNIDPYRTVTGSSPRVFCYIEDYDEIVTNARRSIPSRKQIELWPVPSGDYLVRFEYLKINDLNEADDQPLYRSDVLVWKAGASCAFLLYAKTGDQAWIDLATKYVEQYDRALAGAWLDDLGKFSSAGRIRDVIYTPTRGVRDDFSVNHDPYFLP
jgi:hypothetical protein